MKRVFLIFSFLVLMSLPVCAADNYLTIYAFPPSAHLDWSSPLKLAYGAGIRGRLSFEHGKSKHTIGHCFIELNGSDGFRALTGSTTAPDAPSDSDYITKRGYGLGVLFAPMKGALDNSNKLDRELKMRYKTGKVFFMKLKISQKAFDRMKNYLEEYHKRGYDKIYNGMNKPREGSGAGCSAFAMSFLELGGMLDPVFKKEWIRRVNLPNELVGGPMTGNKVSLSKMIFNAHWAKENEPHIKLELYDPQLMFEWLQKLVEKAKFARVHNQRSKDFSLLKRNFKFIRRGKAIGLYIDATDIPVPTESIWQGKAKK